MINPILERLFQIETIFSILLIVLGTVAAIKFCFYFINELKKNKKLSLTSENILKNIIKIIFISIGITLILNEIGIDITALAVSLGIIGVSLGFAAKDLISNFLGGLFILFDDSMKVGDTIAISDANGEVLQIGLRTTTLITVDNKIIKVPNMLFFTETYVNYTKWDNRRIDLYVTLPYTIDLEKFRERFLEEAKIFNWSLKNKKPQMNIDSLGDMGIKVIISVWTEDTANMVKYKTELAKEIKKIYDELV